MLALVFLTTSSFGNLLALAPTVNAAGSSFKVATYNMLKTEDDGSVPWDKYGRGDKIMTYLKTVDVAGIQEVRTAARNSINGEMKTAGYSNTGINAAVDIIWKSSMFSLVDKGDVIALDNVRCGHQSGVIKHIVWVKLKETASGSEFYFVTTHLEVNAESCRLKQIEKVTGIVAKMTDAPVIFVGDMNSSAGDKEISTIEASGFSDAYNTAATKININSSSITDGPNSGRRAGGEPIDHIFTKAGVSVSSVEIKDQKGSDHLPVEAVVSLSGGSIPMAIGAYNVLGCNHTTGDVVGRMSTLAENINELAYDVVGMSEYNVAECSGKLIEQLATYGNWKDTKHYSKDNIEQTGIIYNADKVTLKSEEVLNTISGCDSMNDLGYGGSCYVRIAHFTTSGGTEFIVANGHYAQGHSAGAADVRQKQIESVIDKLSSESVPVFIVGDVNSAPPYTTSDRGSAYYKDYDHNFYDAVSAGKYQIASQNATEKKNQEWATIDDSKKSAYHIDQVFYRNISAPSYFEVFGCTGLSECGSDHRPVKAIFGVGSIAACGNLTAEQRAQFNAWQVMIYDKSCVCTTASTSSTAGVMSGTNNFQKLATYMASKGLTKYAVAGILGNWYSESKMSAFINESGGSNFPNQGYGLAQWTGSRRTKVLSAIKDSLAKETSTTVKDSFSTYYAAKYAGWPPVADWKKDKQGEINDIPAEVNDAWLKAEVDFMFSEFPAYKIGSAYYLDTLKKYVKVNDSDLILEALNGAKSAGDAATILSVVFEIHQGLDPTQNSRAETAEAMLPDVEAAIGGGASAAGSCATTPVVNSSDLSNLTLDGIDPSTLPMPKGSGHSSWKSSTVDVAKTLWYLFPNDFTAFSTRSSGGAVSTSCHFSGLAIDMMIGNYKDSAVRTRHEAIAEWLMKNRKELGLTNIIYYEKSFNVWGSNTDKPYSEWSSYSNPGGNDDTSAHRNHIHISISPCKS